MEDVQMPKPILKQSNSGAHAGKNKADRDYEVALYHANIIQQRKDIELEILMSIETLMEYPTSATATSTNPSIEDAASFKKRLRPFQPSDYDSLIEERNVLEKCGYTLCPRRSLRDGAGGTYRLLGTGGKAKDFKVVRKEELEKWCSPECARRALYVRVQLSETPAWERRDAVGQDIELLGEEHETVSAKERLELEERQRAGQSALERQRRTGHLAFERGDRGAAATTGQVTVDISEREVTRSAMPPSLENADIERRMDNMHLSVEGHTSKFDSRRWQSGAKDESEEEDDDGLDSMIGMMRV